MLLLLDPYVDVILALALAYLSLKIVQALFGPLTGLPAVGSLIAKAEHAIAQSVADACGLVFGPVDKLIGNSLHGLAELVSRLANVIRTHAQVLADTAALVLGLSLAFNAVKSLAHDLEKRWHGIEAGVKSLTREFRGIEHRVKALERELTKGIGHDLRISVAGLEHEVFKVERPAIRSLRHAEADAQSAIENLYDWLRGKADIVGLGTLAGVIAAAIAAVGNGWLGCKENPFSSSDNPCGLWANLARFLPFLGLLAIGFDFPEFVQAAETVAQGIGDAVGKIEGTFALELEPLPPPL